MQRVSSLLPQWDRARMVDGANDPSYTGDTGTAVSAPKANSNTATNSAGHSLNKSSNNRNSTRSSNSHSTNDSSHRISSIGTQSRNGRSFAKVFSWTGRTGGHKSLTVSPTIANALAMPPASNQMGREAYWPTSLDRECEKAARILKSFCSMFSRFLCYR